MNPVLELEEVAFRCWPAAEVEEHGGWRFRATGSVTRRVNSVWPNRSTGDEPLLARIERAEAFYRSRGLPPAFQITSVCLPADLDSTLAERGYRVTAPTSVQAVTFEAFRMAGQPPQIQTSVLPSPGDEWMSLSADRGRFADTRDVYAGILTRIGARGGFALAKWKGKPIAVGIGVVDGDFLGIFGMLTMPEARRRRAATAILGALVGFGAARGATRAFLQVESGNEGARALYAAAGFRPSHDYHYRVLAQSA
ncbi:MAG TPA: GNAT family N-acetyltransferase [Polyangiaceae bacterium]|nr:GNAT family N-acetyltransferase [Polyangiaceae bacterium]